MELPSPKRRQNPAPRSVVRAVDYMRTNRGGKIAVADLVRASGVAARTLSKHFRAFLGVSPLGYLLGLRLAAARQSLLRGADGGSVTDVAAQSGFTHLGRFSLQYRRRFGETPSATLRRGRAAATSRASRRDGRDEAESDRADPRKPYPWSLAREVPSIAILPCQASVLEPTHRRFAEGLADDIAAALSGVRCLSVIVAAPRARSGALDPQRSARELGARYYLIGRLTAVDRHLRVTVRIAETATGRHVWGDSCDGEANGLAQLQHRLIASVARAILPNIRNCEIDRAQRMRPRDLDAHGLAMRAFPFVLASRPDASRRALELLHRAMEFDPDNGLAAGLAAWCHGQLVLHNGSSTPVQEKAYAIQLADRAAILDSDDPLVLTARCAVHTMAGEFDAADALLARALQRDPSSAWAWERSGWLHAYLGNWEPAIEHFHRAILLEPTSPSNANSLVGIASAHFGAGRYDATVAWTHRALREQPGNRWANRTLSVAYARLGERRRALESFEALQWYCPDLTVARVVEAVPFRQDQLNRLAEGLSDLGLPP